MKKKIIQDVGEEPLVLHSDAQRPLKDQTFLQRALVMAELAMISYNDQAEAQRAGGAIGFTETQLFDNDGSQAYRFRNEHDCVMACRGTEPTEWNDLQADANASLAVVGSFRQSPQRLQSRGRGSVAAAGGRASRQYPTRVVLRALAWRCDGDDLRLPLQASVHRHQSGRAAHVRQPTRAPTSDTCAKRRWSTIAGCTTTTS